MKKYVFALLLCLLATPALAQSPILDISKGRFEWIFDPTGGGTPDEFRVKCGTSTGVYPSVVNQPYSAQPTNTYTMSVEIGLPNAQANVTTYFCIVTAANIVGESGPSNEVIFQAGRVPNSVGQTLKVMPN